MEALIVLDFKVQVGNIEMGRLVDPAMRKAKNLQ